MPNSYIITNQESLNDFCVAAAAHDFVAIDTEFLREKTYWPKLCLVQMAIPDRVALLDPFIEGLDWAPFYALLQNPGVVKVMHSGRQDLEIFWKLTGELPKNLYDTQIAAMVLGQGESISYDRLVQSILKVRIDKTSQYTDWSRRPLSEKQLRYAAGDVIHLCAMYPIMQQRIEQSSRGDWIQAEMDALLNPELYQPDPDKSWQRIRFKSNNRRAHAALRRLAAWREKLAQARNLPRGFILKDETLQEVASHLPHSVHEMESIRGLPNGFANGDWGREALAIVADVEKIPPNELPTLPQMPSQRPDYGDALDLLRVLLRHISEKENVAGKLLATGDELDQLATGEYKDSPDLPCLHGWRYDMFGQKAVALLNGEMGLRLQDGIIVLG